MVTEAPPAFDATQPGTPETMWRAAIDTDTLPPLDLAGVGRLVVLSAHPDDETLGVAGLMHVAHRRGIRVHVVVATDGEGSHPASPTVSPSALAARRRVEVAHAVRMLAPDAGLTRLGLPDSQLSAHRDAMTEALCRVLARETASGTLLCTPYRGDGHADHEAAALAGAQAAARTGCRQVEYPIWLWHWGRPGDVPWERVRAVQLGEEARRAKEVAIAAHASQVRPLSPAAGDEAVLHQAMLQHFRRPFELVVAAAPDHPASHFEDVHAASGDPWGVDVLWYEERKRAVTAAVLPRRRFDHLLELGCSVGALTETLATRSDRLLAVDASEAAVRRARERLVGSPGVSVQRRVLPEEWPAGRFDAVVMSEIGYFLSPGQLDEVIERTAGCLTEQGVLVACHWRHPVRGWPLDGPAVHRRLAERLPGLGLSRLAGYQERDFRIDLYGRSEDVLPPAAAAP